MTRILLFVFTLTSIALLSMGFFLSGAGDLALIFVILSAVWILGLALRWNWAASFGLFLAFGLAAFGYMRNLSVVHPNHIDPVILLMGALFSLPAWDLADFDSRLRLAAPEDETGRLELDHLLRLVLVTAIGGLLAFAATNLHVRLTFEWMVVMMLFVTWGLSRIVNRLLKKEP
jgi:hypothetical protein